MDVEFEYMQLRVVTSAGNKTHRNSSCLGDADGSGGDQVRVGHDLRHGVIGYPGILSRPKSFGSGMFDGQKCRNVSGFGKADDDHGFVAADRCQH